MYIIVPRIQATINFAECPKILQFAVWYLRQLTNDEIETMSNTKMFSQHSKIKCIVYESNSIRNQCI